MDGVAWSDEWNHVCVERIGKYLSILILVINLI